jgi:hypothetical protein
MSSDPRAPDHAAYEAEQAAREAELASMTSTDMMLQATVLLINIGGRRLGLALPSASPEELAAANADRDLDQVSACVDAVRGLLGVLERRLSAAELRPLRDALSQLQMAYAREIQGAPAPGAPANAPGQAAAGQAAPPEQHGAPEQPGASEAPGGEKPASDEDPAGAGQEQRRPGPAESSGRLWVPGR